MKIHRYVVGFVFHSDNSHQVLLINKLRPDWQKGKLNGVGGKIENGETPVEAMRREFKEETGIYLQHWQPTCILDDRRVWRVFFFTSETLQKPELTTDEAPVWVDQHHLPENVVPNLHWLIPLARVAPRDCPLHVIELDAAEAASYEVDGEGQTDRT